MMKSDTHGIRW